MKKLQKLFYSQTLRFQLTFWFLLISLLPLFWITLITYHISTDVILKEAEKHLHVIGIKQINLLKAFFAEKERNVSALAKQLIYPELEETLDKSLKKYGKESTEYLNELAKLEPELRERAEALNYRNFILIDDDGTVVLSFEPQVVEPGIDLLKSKNSNQKILSELFKRTLEAKKLQVSPLAFFTEDSTPSIFIATPLLGNNETIYGVLMFQINNSAFYNIVENFRGVGNTGETLIVFDLDSELVVFSSYYGKETVPQVYRLSPKSSFGKFMLEVLNGTPTIQYVTDFHGNMTIAIGKKINPDTNWAVITKIDQKELLSTVNILKYLSWLLLFITAIVVTVIATHVARKLSSPLLMLIQKTKLMAAGDLSQRIELPYKNEIGKLGDSLNDMAMQIADLIHNLDALVAKRTLEVENKNVQLNQKIEELKETQNRMVIQEKLASLGSLTAGIAHEIKNPLNFVNNFAELSLDIQKNLALNLEKIMQLIPPDLHEEFKEELNFLNLNLEKILKHGKRADSIVHNMLQHSRGAPGEKVETDINKLLDEYVDLAFHGMRAKDSTFNVKIIKEYAPNLDKIVVSPQEISRVFLNLLNNAFYSVNERKKSAVSDYQPVVKVSSLNLEQFIEIVIWDNGLGISENVQEKLFTPFFTTKPAGEGTGLGLSLSYNIVVQGHAGTLKVDSEIEEFAQFTISLPKK